MEEVTLFICKALPLLNDDAMKNLLSSLKDHGVHSLDDLKFIEPSEDLKDSLTTVERRKLKKAIEEFANAADTSVTNSADTSCTDSVDTSYANLLTTLENPADNVEKNKEPASKGIERCSTENWISSFNIPYHKFPVDTLNKCINGEIISPAECREVIRVVCSQIMIFSKKPGKKNLEVIAKNMVAKYPGSFQNRVNMTIVSGGYSTLLNQLIARIENENRQSNKSSKRKVEQSLGTGIKITATDSYGCLKFLPELPSSENEGSQKEKKEYLKKIYNSVKDWDHVLIKQNMDDTYVSQRITIISRSKISDVIDEHPFLTISAFLFNHFHNLMGINIIDKLDAAYEEKLPELLGFLKSKCQKTKDMTANKSPYAYITQLCRYFEENEHAILLIVPETESLSDILQNDVYPITPHIISFGDPYSLEPVCVVILEQKAVSEFVSIKVAVAVWFGCYYVYNLRYPVESAATLEFIQRVFLDINPEKGTKQAKRYGKRTNVHTKVLRLVSQLSQYKNMWHL